MKNTKYVSVIGTPPPFNLMKKKKEKNKKKERKKERKKAFCEKIRTGKALLYLGFHQTHSSQNSNTFVTFS